MVTISACLGGVPSDAFSEISLNTTGDMRTIYAWSKDRCDDRFIPDAPARVFRRSDGKIALISTHFDNWMMVGQDFQSLKPVCRSIMPSNSYLPKGFGEMWIEATYTSDGKHISALVSEDAKVLEKANGCVQGGLPGRCWRSDITAAKSDDMGLNFKPSLPVDRKVVSVIKAYPRDGTERIGAFTTSNIVKRDGFHYVFVWVQGEDPKNSGNCLLRTASPDDATSWRAWGGKEFDVDLGAGTATAQCKLVSRSQIPNEVRSLSYSPKLGAWIAVFTSRLKLGLDKQAVPGFYFAQSQNLDIWTDIKRIMPAPTVPREQQNDSFYIYPSLIDPKSKSINFDTLDNDELMLLFTVHHLSNGRGSMNRDISYVPIRIR